MPTPERLGSAKLISLVIPVYNEEENLRPLYQEIVRVWKEELVEYGLEIIFVDDGSADGSAELILRLAQEDPRVKLIQFSRNFGKEAATTAGLHYARGQAAIILDADLQHPPQLIPRFVKKWQEGAQVVVGTYLRKSRQPFFRRVATYLYYRVLHLIGEEHVELDSSDFRLLDRQVIESFRKLPERSRVTRGLIDWLGFERGFVPLEPRSRYGGRSQYNLSRLVGFTLSGLISHSLFPLKLSLFLGFFITAVASLIGFLGLLDRFSNSHFALGISNLGFLALLQTFLVGVVLINLGLVALYLVNIQKETQRRPLYVIKKHTLGDE